MLSGVRCLLMFLGDYSISEKVVEPSLTAAETRLRILEQKGADAYLTYHNAHYASGHADGSLTQEDIKNVASKAGQLSESNNSALDELLSIDDLARNIALQGTLCTIIPPTHNRTKYNTAIIP